MSEFWEPKLKPCPFCGGEAFFKESIADENYPMGTTAIFCSNCSSFTEDDDGDFNIEIVIGAFMANRAGCSLKGELAAVWNKRADALLRAREVEHE